MTDVLVQFLCDRLDEAREEAVEAGGDTWRVDRFTRSGGVVFTTGELPIVEFDSDPARLHVQDRAAADFHQAAHIALHNPAHVLRDIEMKRQLIALHYSESAEPINADAMQRSGPRCAGCVMHEHPCRTLRLLALPYSHHRDYREEWRL